MRLLDDLENVSSTMRCPQRSILHDAAGTEMGVAIITALVYTAPARLLKPTDAE